MYYVAMHRFLLVLMTLLMTVMVQVNNPQSVLQHTTDLNYNLKKRIKHFNKFLYKFYHQSIGYK